MTTINEYSGPLAGLKVIDFGHYYAGPLVGMLLADQGATVIRIVKPVGLRPEGTTPAQVGGACKQDCNTPAQAREIPEQQFRLFNRNKKILALDLKTENGKAQALSLIKSADVLIENFRPGVMKRLGLDYSSLKANNPGLVYLSLPGFASTDRARAGIQAWEGILGAAAGLFTEAVLSRKPLGYPPVYTSMPFCSSYGAAHGAIGVSAALLSRQQDGVGCYIEVPLVDAGLSSCTDRHILSILGGATQHPDYLRAVMGANAKLPDEIATAVERYRYCPGDSPQTQLQKVSESMGMHNHYVACDGKKLTFPLPKPWHAERFYKALGIYDTLINEGFTIDPAGMWTLDRSSNNLVSAYVGLSPRVVALTQAVIQTQSGEYWETLMEKIGVPCAMIRTRDEWLSLLPLKKSGLFMDMDNGQSRLTTPGRLVDVSGPQNRLMGIAPEEAQVIDATQAEHLFSFQPPKVTPATDWFSKSKGDLLNGKNVLDLCSIVAGPNASYTLAQFGAEVIRVEPPNTFNLPVHLICCLEVNQGKRSMILDIKTPAGRNAFEKLLRWADVVVHNRIDHIAERLGMTFEQLQAINPRLVVCQLVALGATYRGGWENRLGFDEAANKPSGQYAHFGSLEYPVPFGGVSADLMAGLGCAFGALLGLYQRQVTGVAAECRSSLARATNYTQFPWMILENGSSDWDEVGGQSALGPHPWQRLYQCRDGWVYVGTRKTGAALLATAVTGQPSTDEHRLQTAFATQCCDYWSTRLADAGIACHRVLSLDDIHTSEAVRRVGNTPCDEPISGALQSLRWDQHPCGLPVILPSPSWVRVGDPPTCKRLTPAPRVGQHTRELLAELGYSQPEIDELINRKVAHDFLPVLGSRDAYFFEQVG